MIVDGNAYKVNILMLCMESEISVTLMAVETLLENLEESVTISVLLNGGHSSKTGELFSKYGNIKYYESEKNLGVAGGRNFLLRTEECKASDIVMIIDNDVIPPQDYIRNLLTFLLKHEDAAIVGAAVADIKTNLGLDKLDQSPNKGVWGNNILKLQSKDIKQRVLSNLDSDKLYHMGNHENYFFAYFSILPLILSLVSRFLQVLGIDKQFLPNLKFNTRCLESIKQGADKYPVSNVVGCSQVFRRTLLDEIGYLDDRFNPYAFEDAHFCIRALKAGYRNYVDTNTWLYHGTDSRHKDRTVQNRFEHIANHYEKQTILASLILSNPVRLRFVMVKLLFVGLLISIAKANIREIRHLNIRTLVCGTFFLSLAKANQNTVLGYKARVRGFIQGLNTLGQDTDEERNVC